MEQEYNATIVHVSSKDALFCVEETALGEAAFVRFEELPGACENPARKHNLIRAAGDILLSIDGVRTNGMHFKEVQQMLDESRRNRAVSYLIFSNSQNADVRLKTLEHGIKQRVERVEQLKREINQRQQNIACLEEETTRMKDELNQMRMEVYDTKLEQAAELLKALSPKSETSDSPAQNTIASATNSPPFQPSLPVVMEPTASEEEEMGVGLSRVPGSPIRPEQTQIRPKLLLSRQVSATPTKVEERPMSPTPATKPRLGSEKDTDHVQNPPEPKRKRKMLERSYNIPPLKSQRPTWSKK